MGKLETIQALRPAFLKGKSQEYIDNFLAKDIDRQYASIKNWEFRMKKINAEMADEDAIRQAIDNVKILLRKSKNINDNNLNSIRESIKSLHEEVDLLKARLRQNMISELERQQQEINEKLRKLKGEC
ncbi:MAG: hypothetical protein NC201_03535 [Prevotella sp.]|nr:hypothetical protein [Bacteroides sp.]MCM1366300.1 hypothetical protein [Prevotella sp.]MCM1437104.1 hypothetical protein [Prevotella sp.]